MTPEQRRRVEDLFERLSDVPRDELEASLAQLCPDDAAVRAEVASLLSEPSTTAATPIAANRGDGTTFVHEAFAELKSAAPQGVVVGDVVGPYRIVQLIGEGGMGAVYKAEQQRPHRLVALKVIRPGYMTAAMLKRFEYEADVLARLEHPGIARIYEAGIANTEFGKLPFFALELVEGPRLDTYIASTNPPLRERLALFIAICQAVQHAHQKGIIHRDLKPANILITADGSPKVLDFGVARMTDSDIRSTTLHTMSGQLIGTLPYMAPEQAAGNVRALDTSSDVYALGVIAYELLSGRMPYSLEGKALHEAVSVICQEDPTRLSSIDRNLRGDVETIVRKALEKDRTRRYATAGELADDVKRYLDYEPIAARPPSTWYQLRKFARRNRVLVTGVAVALLGLVALSVVLGTAYVRERRLRMQRDDERNVKVAVGRFLEDILAGAAPDRMRDPAVRESVIKDMIGPAAANVREKFADEPLMEAYVRYELARLYREVGRSDLAIPQVQRTLEIRQQLRPPDHFETLICYSAMALFLEELGKLDEAETFAKQSVEAHRRAMGNDDLGTLNAMAALAKVYRSQGRDAQALPLFAEVFERRRRIRGDADPETVMALNNYATAVYGTGDIPRASELFRQAWLGYRRAQGEDGNDTMTAQYNYAATLTMQGKMAEALPLYETALAHSQRVFGEEHSNTIQLRLSYASTLADLGRATEAEPFARLAVEQFRRIRGNGNPFTLDAINRHARILLALGRTADAEPLFGEVYDQIRHASPAARSRSGAQVRELLANLADVCERTNRPDEAAKWRAELAAMSSTTMPTTAQIAR